MLLTGLPMAFSRNVKFLTNKCFWIIWRKKKGHPTAEFMLKLKKGVNHKHPNHNFVLEVSLPKVCISTSRACYCKYSVYNKEMNHPLGTNPHTHTQQYSDVMDQSQVIVEPWLSFQLNIYKQHAERSANRCCHHFRLLCVRRAFVYKACMFPSLFLVFKPADRCSSIQL